MTPKKMMKMARRWQKEALKSGSHDLETNKGHFVAYTTDNSRFVMPLHYLENNVFLELLRMSEDEFGLPRNGPITLACDSILMKYLVAVFERGFNEDLEKALIVSVV
ncbi:unnamed protein product [Lactuca virosa]|uniref:Uncharacterized protein n=2 Tax=Lactuca TaxID=4235 RepID=A0AA36DYE5_LACSI|nr:unnamed protein product [Lactuca virosa]CAI9275755.1 unnamed protein product [Lactuca saligna]